MLKPGGKVMITVPAFMWLWSYNDVINEHQRRYTATELAQKLEISGFRVKRKSYNNFFVFPLIAGVRFLRPEAPELDIPCSPKKKRSTRWRWNPPRSRSTPFSIAWAGWKLNWWSDLASPSAPAFSASPKSHRSGSGQGLGGFTCFTPQSSTPNPKIHEKINQ